MMESERQEILGRIEARLRETGLDLFHAFDAARYNDAIRGNPRLAPLPLFDRGSALALLIGNTRALWPRFLSAFRSRVELQRDPHPLDRYVAGAVTSCLGALPWRAELRFSHEGGARLVSMLHAAQTSGLAHVGPAHLAIHPTHGPWIGLRAVVVVDEDAPAAGPSRIPPCERCPAPCRDALDRAMAAGAAATWRDWLAARDACPVGRASRYSEPQLVYHYAKDRAVLEDPSAP